MSHVDDLNLQLRSRLPMTGPGQSLEHYNSKHATQAPAYRTQAYNQKHEKLAHTGTYTDCKQKNCETVMKAIMTAGSMKTLQALHLVRITTSPIRPKLLDTIMSTVTDHDHVRHRRRVHLTSAQWR